MQKSAEKIVTVCMNVCKDESVLIITDTNKVKIGRAIFEAASAISANTAMLMMKPTKRHADEPQDIIAKKMLDTDVIIAPTTYSLTHTMARKKATEQGARIATMPGITEGMMEDGAITADFRQVESLTVKLSKILDTASEARITSKLGTDVTIGLEGREAISDTGIFHNSGDFGNLPAGESFIAPVEGTTEGTVVVDGSMMDHLIKEPITLEIKDGNVVSFVGNQLAKMIESEVNTVGPLARNIAELGIGTNDKAKLSGNVLEDEKILGTVHIAIGNNATFGGNVNVGLHFDGIIQNPTLFLDDKKVIQDGNLLV